ncbi:90 kDa surface protein, putative, partial [Trypanosoma cruzi marinkellei]
NCTDSASGAGKMICGMGVGNCAPEALQSRTKDGGAGSVVFTINVTSPTPNVLEKWWERHVEKKAATVEGDLAKPRDEVTAGSPKQKAPVDTSFSQDSGSPAAGAEGPLGAPPPPPGGAAATTDPSPSAASQVPDSAPSGEPHDAAHSNSAASAAPESSPDPNSTAGGGHSSHDPSVEPQEETSATPPTQLSQTGEDGGAAGGAEEDTAATTTDTASSEGNSTAASTPAPLSSAPTTSALENRVGADACFHDTRLHTLPLLVLAVLTYG